MALKLSAMMSVPQVTEGLGVEGPVVTLGDFIKLVRRLLVFNADNMRQTVCYLSIIHFKNGI